MLGQVGEQDGQVEPNGLGGVVVRLHELNVVDLTLVISLRVAAHQEENLLAGLIKCLNNKNSVISLWEQTSCTS